MKIKNHIQVVLFDHDDALVGTLSAKGAHHKHVAATYFGKELSDEEIRKHWGKPLKELICLLYGTDDVEDAMAKNRLSHGDFPTSLGRKNHNSLVLHWVRLFFSR